MMDKILLKNLPELPFDVTESLNQLRINLGFCGDEVKTIMVSSSTPNEGKSFIAVNLWRMMAEVGERVLLVDCDMRNSEMRTRYGLSCEQEMNSVAQYLAGQVNLFDAIYETSIPNAFLIPMYASVTNPALLLESDRFAQMMKELKMSFDYIIVDTPPLTTVADALNIVPHCDGTVLVVRSGVTSRKVVDHSYQLLRRSEVPVLGIVLNRAEMTGHAKSYYNRYSYYGKYKKYKYGYDYGRGENKKS